MGEDNNIPGDLTGTGDPGHRDISGEPVDGGSRPSFNLTNNTDAAEVHSHAHAGEIEDLPGEVFSNDSEPLLYAPPESPPEPEPHKFYIADFWKRIWAFLDDSIALGIVGLIIGAVFSGVLSRLGGWEMYIGLAIAVCYFGFMNSSKYKGQTVGKRHFKIKVVDKDNNYIPLKESILRAFLLQFPFFVANGMSIPGLPPIPTIFLFFIMGSTATTFILGLVYFYILNSKTRQVPHDLICKTYVVKADYKGEIEPSPPKKIHLIIVSVISFLIILSFFLVMGALYSHFGGSMNSLNNLQKVLAEEYPDYRISVVFQEMHFNGRDTTICNFNILGDKLPVKEGQTVVDFVEKIRKKVPGIANYDVYNVTLQDGFNIGLSSAYTFRTYSYRPDIIDENGGGKITVRVRNLIKIGLFKFSTVEQGGRSNVPSL